MRLMSQMGQKAKCSLRADVFRCSPNNGHYQDTSECLFGANSDRRIATKSLVIRSLRRRIQAAWFRSWSIFRLGHRPDLQSLPTRSLVTRRGIAEETVHDTGLRGI